VLQTVAKALQSDRLAGFAFRIEGHADPRGTPEFNLKLSEDRARSVVAYLTAKAGVLPERLQPVGKGSTELLNLQQPDAAENRRVTIVTTQ
jgi:outer membrane protein OmpA-like peptidoglycan-associated protein